MSECARCGLSLRVVAYFGQRKFLRCPNECEPTFWWPSPPQLKGGDA